MKFVQLVNGALAFMLMASTATAQTKPAGLYSTADDFQQQKITYALDCSNGKDKLKLNDLFGSSKGYIISKGEKHSFTKRSVYGYRTCKNENYRFFKNTAYRIVDTAEFYIYYRNMQAGPNKGKGTLRADTYFFSTQANNTIQLLTLDNLKKAFPGNRSFQYALDAHFRSDKDLAAWDAYGKTYKVKYLYEQTLK